jgi:hypothetical protein
MLPEELKEVLTPLDSLIFLRRGEEFGDPVSGLLYQPKINGEGGLDHRKSKVQHGGQLSDCQAAVLLNGGGDSGYNVLSPLGFFRWSEVNFPSFTAFIMRFIWLFDKALSL